MSILLLPVNFLFVVASNWLVLSKSELDTGNQPFSACNEIEVAVFYRSVLRLIACVVLNLFLGNTLDASLPSEVRDVSWDTETKHVLFFGRHNPEKESSRRGQRLGSLQVVQVLSPPGREGSQSIRDRFSQPVNEVACARVRARSCD